MGLRQAWRTPPSASATPDRPLGVTQGCAVLQEEVWILSSGLYWEVFARQYPVAKAAYVSRSCRGLYPGANSELSHPLLVPLVTGWARLSCRADICDLLREELVPLLTEGWFEALASELRAYYANV